MAWNTFHTTVRITTGGVSYDLPVDSLTVRAVPYSGTGSIAVELFDGRRVQRIDGWRHEAELSWREMKATDNVILLNAIQNLIYNGAGVLELDPASPGKTMNVIVEDAGEAIQAVFNGRVRGRPASVKLVSTDVHVLPHSWITSAT